MSVALLIEHGVNENEYLPIAGQRLFEDVWLPKCDALNLTWVPLFKTGVSCTQEELPFILDELTLLKDHFSKSDENGVYQRLIVLIEKLESLLGKEISFFIG